jgi:hypothetical protein
MNFKSLSALFCALVVSTEASTLDVSYNQNQWVFSLTIGTDLSPAVNGTWAIDGNAIAHGSCEPFSPFRFTDLPANYADIWFLTPNAPHVVSFTPDDTNILALVGDEPYFITAPTVERPVNSVPEVFGGVWSLCIFIPFAFKRLFRTQVQ